MTGPTQAIKRRRTQLAKQLQDVFALTDFETVARTREAERDARSEQPDEASLRGYLVGAPVEWGSHFETGADLLVFDFALGTVGLVHLLPTLSKLNSEKSVEHAIDVHLGKAAYLKHLFAAERETGKGWPYSVELVLVGPASRPAQQRCRRVVGRALQKQETTASYVAEVGIGYIDDLQDEASLRRAFPWLLHATRAWLRDQAAEADTEDLWPGFDELKELRLAGYRLSGARSLRLDRNPGGPRLHVVHGPNGTGKSALTEALEFVATGRIDRARRAVPDKTTYLEVVRNVDAEEAKIELNGDDDFVVEATGLADRSGRSPFALDPLSVRLNQADVDMLVQGSPARRAERFLSAYFPDVLSDREAGRHSEELLREARSKIAELAPVLERGDAALRKFAGWSPALKGSPPRRPYRELLDEWLEGAALLRLGRAALEVQEVLKGAKELGWDADPKLIRMIPKGTPKRLREFLDGLERNVNAQREDLSSAEGKRSPRGSSKHLSISAAERADLDRVGELVFAETSGLGKAVERALRTGTQVAEPWGTIGTRSWAKPALNRIAWLLEVVEDETLLLEPPSWLPSRGPLHSTAQLIREAHAEMAQSVKKGWDQVRIESALNELMALFTPARWAYRDISMEVRPQEDDGVDVLQFSVERDAQRPAELIYNTAELSLLALSLFLLNAVRQANPFQTLALDDPLQNLDEMSVCALARGWNRLTRLSDYAPGWHFILFAHSDADCERIAREAPCRRYKIPWLTPHLEVAATEIESIDDVCAPELATLGDLMGEAPERN